MSLFSLQNQSLIKSIGSSDIEKIKENLQCLEQDPGNPFVVSVTSVCKSIFVNLHGFVSSRMSPTALNPLSL